MPQFNRANSYIEFPGILNNNLPQYSINFWAYPTAYDDPFITSWVNYNPDLCGDYAISTSSGFIYVSAYDGSGEGFTSADKPPLNQWSMVTVTATGGGTGSTTVYVNGGSPSSGTSSYVSQAGSTITLFGSQISPNCATVPGNALKGDMANVQFYNTSLSTNAIAALYNEGIEGAPIISGSNNLVAWFPLDGNSNDYSGNSNNAQYANLTFQTMAQLFLDVLAKNGSAISNNAMVGVAISNGIAGSSPFATYGKPVNGIFTPVLLYNTINPNVTVYSFNGNLSIPANLIGWWPLSFGDLGGTPSMTYHRATTMASTTASIHGSRGRSAGASARPRSRAMRCPER